MYNSSSEDHQTAVEEENGPDRPEDDGFCRGSPGKQPSDAELDLEVWGALGPGHCESRN